MPELSNENLSLWLKARDGLPCEEARALIQELNDTDREYSDYLSPEEHDDALSEAENSVRQDVIADLHEMIIDAKDLLDRLEKLRDRLEKA